jgi:hypothetical protein
MNVNLECYKNNGKWRKQIIMNESDVWHDSKLTDNNNHHHHHVAIKELGHLLILSNLTHPEFKPG